METKETKNQGIPASMLPGEIKDILRLLQWFGSSFKKGNRTGMDFAQEDLLWYINFMIGVRSDSQKYRIQQLEDMLSAVGAGGVGPLQSRPHGEPTADFKSVPPWLEEMLERWPELVDSGPWRVTVLGDSFRVEDHTHTEIQSVDEDGETCRWSDYNDAKGHLIATAPDLLRMALATTKKTNLSSSQPTDYQVDQLARQKCLRWTPSTAPRLSDHYTFDRHTLLEFARALREGGAA